MLPTTPVLPSTARCQYQGCRAAGQHRRRFPGRLLRRLGDDFATLESDVDLHAASMNVPASPATMRSMSASAPMAASLPVTVANSQAASILGPMLPAGNSYLASSAGVVRVSLRASGVPQS